jgi:hypothetical protein
VHGKDGKEEVEALEKTLLLTRQYYHLHKQQVIYVFLYFSHFLLF